MTEQQPIPTGPRSVASDSLPGAFGPGAALPEGEGWTANLRRRVLSGVPALFAVLAVVSLAPGFVVAAVMTAVGVMGMLEFQHLLPDILKRHARLSFVLTAAGLIGLGGMLFGPAGLNLMLLIAILLIVADTWFRHDSRDEWPLPTAGVTALGLLLVPWVLNHIPLIHGLPGGGGWLALLVIVVTLNDTLAYLIGSLLGTRLLIPQVSPHKTVEGAVAGLAGGAAGGLIGWLWLLSFDAGPGFFEALILGAVLAAVAQCGDLLESKLKRLVGADDSGSFLPGHGGLLDRLDAYSLSAPLLYYYLALTSHAG